MMEEALIVKQIVGECTPSENLAVLEWLKADVKNQEEYDRLSATWAKSKEIEPKYFNTEQAWKTFQSKNQTKTFRIGTVYKAAAAAVILLGLFIGIKQFNPSVQNIAKVNNSDTATLIALTDGSEITMGKGKIEYLDNFNEKERAIKLKGKAFFKVASNPNKKFSVKTKECLIEVLGTQFEVDEQDDIVTVSVLEGKVAFTSPKGSTLLTKGQAATYEKGNENLRLTKTKKNKFSHITRNLIFKNDKLINAVQDIEKMYDVTFMVQKSIYNYPISTQFENESLDNILKVLEVTLNIDVIRKGDFIKLRRKEAKNEN